MRPRLPDNENVTLALARMNASYLSVKLSSFAPEDWVLKWNEITMRMKEIDLSDLSDLIPCHFCGCSFAAFEIKRIFRDGKMNELFTVECQMCYARGPATGTIDLAKRYWNKDATF